MLFAIRCRESDHALGSCDLARAVHSARHCRDHGVVATRWRSLGQLAPRVCSRTHLNRALAPYRQWLAGTQAVHHAPAGLTGNDPKEHLAVPFRHPNDSPVRVRIEGENLLGIALVVLLDAETYSIERELSFPESSTCLWVQLPAAITPGTYLIVLIPLDVRLNPAWAAWIMESTSTARLAMHARQRPLGPEHVDRAVGPVVARRHGGPAGAQRITGAPEEHRRDRPHDPACRRPGRHRPRHLSRARADQGRWPGSEPRRSTCSRASIEPRATAVSPRIAMNNRGTVVTVRGAALAAATQIEIKQGTTRIAVAFAAIDDATPRASGCRPVFRPASGTCW